MSNHRVPAEWGLCFEGNHEAFCIALDMALSTHSDPFRYVEIGLGYGGGLRAVSQYLGQTGALFLLDGVDISTCNEQASNPANYPFPDRTEIHLCGGVPFLKEMEKKKIKADFVFIDGCHGEPCARADFLAAEKVVRSGGVVCFHDTDPGCQDIHMQPHCGTGIAVRAAVSKLGLLDDSRPGWKKLFETSGNKDKGGHGCLFVIRL